MKAVSVHSRRLLGACYLTVSEDPGFTQGSSPATTLRGGCSGGGVRGPAAGQRRAPARVARRRATLEHPFRARDACASRGSSGGSCANDEGGGPHSGRSRG